MDNGRSILYSRRIPVMRDEFDVIVCGAGPAGICAAVSAARYGARVLLAERYGSVGGMLTMGAVSPILGSVSRGTMYDEICHRIRAGAPVDAAADKHTRNGREVAVDREAAKAALDAMIAESGVTLWLGAAAADVLTDGEGDKKKVGGVVFATARGLCAVRARCVIDCTGNGDVAAAAGCSFDIGRGGDGRLQPMTLEFALDNVDADAITVWGGSDPIKIPGGEFAGMEFRELCKLKNREGELPENVTIVRLHHALRPDVRIVNATQENNADPLDPAAVAGAELSLRAQIGVCAAFLRKYIPGYENCRVTDSADTVGVRESRRIKGMDSVCDADVEDGRMREDAVVHNAWFLIDIHNPAGSGQAEGHSHPAQPYDIPYGALVPCDVGGLLVAGRCISGTHRAHASYRVMSICMAMGEAAGVAAANAAERRVDPADITAEDIRAELRSRGIDL